MAGTQCCKNPPTLSSSSGAGSVVQFAGLNTYISTPSHSKLAVILISDVFGYEAPNLRKLADKVAAAGFYVVVPDFLKGDPFTFEDVERPLLEWIKPHSPKIAEDAKQVIVALKGQGVTSVGAVGFCWGAKVVVELAKSKSIQAGVLLHPSFCSVEDIKDVQAPITVLGAEFDDYAPLELIKQFEEILSSKPEVDGNVKIFPGMSHGWAVRYDVEDKEAVKAAEEAHQDMLDWLIKYVK